MCRHLFWHDIDILNQFFVTITVWPCSSGCIWFVMRTSLRSQCLASCCGLSDCFIYLSRTSIVSNGEHAWLVDCANCRTFGSDVDNPGGAVWTSWIDGRAATFEWSAFTNRSIFRSTSGRSTCRRWISGRVCRRWISGVCFFPCSCRRWIIGRSTFRRNTSVYTTRSQASTSRSLQASTFEATPYFRRIMRYPDWCVQQHFWFVVTAKRLSDSIYIIKNNNALFYDILLWFLRYLKMTSFGIFIIIFYDI